MALAGVLGSFADGAERVLQKMAGLRLSESTVERTTEAAGQRVRQQLDEGKSLGPTRDWQWQRDARGQRCAYVSLDATGVRQQGPGGHHAEGRMAYVGMVYNPRSEHDPKRPPPRQVRYLSGFFELDDLGRQLHREALEVGWADGRSTHRAVATAASGLEQFFKRFFPKAVCILDFFHAKEYLVELGQALYGEDESARQTWLDDVCHRLKHEGGPTVRRRLEELDLGTASAAVREVHRKTVQYFRNHEHRMDYPTYVRNGWQIGSGPVESACKTVVGNRLKGGGMRWGEDGLGRRLPPPRPLPQRARLLGLLLESSPQLTPPTNLTLTRCGGRVDRSLDTPRPRGRDSGRQLSAASQSESQEGRWRPQDADNVTAAICPCGHRPGIDGPATGLILEPRWPPFRRPPWPPFCCSSPIVPFFGSALTVCSSGRV